MTVPSNYFNNTISTLNLADVDQGVRYDGQVTQYDTTENKYKNQYLLGSGIQLNFTYGSGNPPLNGNFYVDDAVDFAMSSFIRYAELDGNLNTLDQLLQDMFGTVGRTIDIVRGSDSNNVFRFECGALTFNALPLYWNLAITNPQVISGASSLTIGKNYSFTVDAQNGAGQTNDGANVGTAGVGLYKDKTGVTLNFKKVNAGSNKLTVFDDVGNDEIDIDVAPANINIGDLNNAPASAVVGISDAQSLTNKTIDADNNTISNIDDNEIKALAGIDASKLADGSVSNAEFQYINSLSSNAQSQLDTKITASSSDTLTNKTISYLNNTLTTRVSEDPADSNRLIVTASGQKMVSYPLDQGAYTFAQLNAQTNMQSHYIADNATYSGSWTWNDEIGPGGINAWLNQNSATDQGDYIQFNNGVSAGGAVSNVSLNLDNGNFFFYNTDGGLTLWAVVENVSYDGTDFGNVICTERGGNLNWVGASLFTGSNNLHLRYSQNFVSSGTLGFDTGYDILNATGKQIIIVSFNSGTLQFNAWVNGVQIATNEPVVALAGNTQAQVLHWGSKQNNLTNPSVRGDYYDVGYRRQFSTSGEQTDLFKALANQYSPELLNEVDANLNLNRLSDVALSTVVLGNHLYYNGTNWANFIPSDGSIKVNSFDTNITSGAKPTFIGLTTEQAVEYQIGGETHLNLNASSFPTTSVPLAQNGGVYADANFYIDNGGAGADRFIQCPILGAVERYRVECSYTNKSSSNSGRIQLRLWNPLSGFSLEVALPLAQGVTADNLYGEFSAINDAANLPPPLGSGAGYRLSVSSTISLDLVIDSITRITSFYSPRS